MSAAPPPADPSALFNWRSGPHVVVGGAGFLGSHICDAIMARGGSVVCVDSLVTGSLANIRHLLGGDGFRFERGDGRSVLDALRQDRGLRPATVWSMASLASPVAYATRPMETLWAGSEVHRACLEMAADHGARVVYTSTSEVYGDPEVHPQTEGYRGSVATTGPRSQYDEAKRFGEAMAMVYLRTLGLDVRIARIFNTYGPRMAMDDGRMVPAFLLAALRGAPMRIQGDGSATRSLCFVDDMVDGLMRLCAADLAAIPSPPVVNLGRPDERAVAEVAKLCSDAMHGEGGRHRVVMVEAAQDDPRRRCPDISLAQAVLSGWRPDIALEEGLRRTAAWLRTVIVDQ